MSFESEIEVAPVESRIRPDQRDRHGLYPHELLMLSYAHIFTYGQSEFQGFWWYQYGVREPERLLANLEVRGFIDLGGVREAMGFRTAAQLKNVLSDYGLKKTGSKSEIIQRLCDAVPTEELQTLFPERYFVPTSAGTAALEDGKYASYIHRTHRFNLDIFSLAEIVGNNPGQDYRELLLAYGAEIGDQFASENNWGLYRNVKFETAEILAEMGRLHDAIQTMSEVIFWDLSGLDNNFDMRFLGIIASDLFPYERSRARTAPGVIDLIFVWTEKLGMSDLDLRNLIREHLSTFSSPLNLFSAEECAEITILERVGDLPGLTSVYEDAQKRFASNFPSV